MEHLVAALVTAAFSTASLAQSMTPGDAGRQHGRRDACSFGEND